MFSLYKYYWSDSLWHSEHLIKVSFFSSFHGFNWNGRTKRRTNSWIATCASWHLPFQVTLIQPHRRRVVRRHDISGHCPLFYYTSQRLSQPSAKEIQLKLFFNSVFVYPLLRPTDFVSTGSDNWTPANIAVSESALCGRCWVNRVDERHISTTWQFLLRSL